MQSNRQKIKLILFLERLNFVDLEWYRKTCFQLGFMSRLDLSCKKCKLSRLSIFCQLNDFHKGEFIFLKSWSPFLVDKRHSYVLRYLISTSPDKTLKLIHTLRIDSALAEVSKIYFWPEIYTESEAIKVLSVDKDRRYYLNRYNYFISCNHQKALSCLNDYLILTNTSSVALKCTDRPLYVDNIKPKDKAIPVNTGPLVSVIITAYNEAELIASAVESIINQTYTSLQIVFVNDASTDNTQNIFTETCLQFGFKNFKCLNTEERSGPFASRNYGVQFSDGEIISFHDADDWAHPCRIETHVKAMLDNNSIASTSQLIRVMKNGVLFSKFFFPINRMAMVSLMIRRNVLDDLGYFFIDVLGADTEYLERVKLFYGDSSVDNIGQILTFSAHRHNSQTTSKKTGTPTFGINKRRVKSTDLWRSRHIEMLDKQRPYYVEFER